MTGQSMTFASARIKCFSANHGMEAVPPASFSCSWFLGPVTDVGVCSCLQELPAWMCIWNRLATDFRYILYAVQCIRSPVLVLLEAVLKFLSLIPNSRCFPVQKQLWGGRGKSAEMFSTPATFPFQFISTAPFPPISHGFRTPILKKSSLLNPFYLVYHLLMKLFFQLEKCDSEWGKGFDCWAELEATELEFRESQIMLKRWASPPLGGRCRAGEPCLCTAKIKPNFLVHSSFPGLFL